MSLTTYKQKRNFKKTTEPRGKKKHSGKKGQLRFVVQRHHASRLHYDFRLEMEGVLKSWAVPKGPSLNPQDKRLAMMVEDHPYDYKDFEGEIPSGYGKGNVMIYDEGFYEPVKETENPEKELLSELKNGSLKIVLKGKKLKGEWALVKMKSKSDKQENAWLLIKHKDREAVKTKFDIEAEIPKKIKEKGNKVGGENAPSRKKPTQSTQKPTSKKSESTPPQEYYTPMLTKLVDDPFTDKDWIFENKFDGYRAIASVQNGKVQLYSRNHNSFNKKYPSIVKELEKLEMDVVLDGEILALDEKGNPKFQLLQNHQRKKVDKLLYYVFDIIYLNGHETLNMELSLRKELLDSVFQNINSEIILPTEVVDTEGEKYFEKIKKQKGEGIIAKRKDSPYRPGKRNHEWLKIKTDQRQETIICGFTAPQGSRKYFGSLILGIYEEGKLVHTGNCGTGFKEDDLKALHKKMKPLERKTSPFAKTPEIKNPTWITPKLMCEVKFSEWTSEKNMRHPVFIGLRSDKKPKEITREIPMDEEVAKDNKSKPEKRESSTKKKASPKKRENDISIKLNGHKVQLTNRNKIYWPDEKITKGDLLDYYQGMADIILPYLKDRPLSLNRHPNGIKNKGFFQKDINLDQAPKWIKTEKIHSEGNDKDIDYLICNNEATLMYMVNLGCIEINPWLSRTPHLDKPDYLLLDLDPVDIDFEAVVETALAIKETLDDLGLIGFCKTSGSKGIHIYVPFAARYTYETTRLAAKLIASHSLKKIPKIGSLERSPKNRKKKVYLDYLQNSRGQTIACPYSVRPKPGATVSTPLEWKELEGPLKITDFNIHNMQNRLKEKDDLWKKHPVTKNSLKAAIEKLEEL